MITIVVGKPGSGKSYDTVDRLVEDLLGRVRQKGEIPVICTNLAINRDNFEEYFVKRGVDRALIRVEYLDADFFSAQLWWNNLPADSRIILDESQYYLSSARISKLEQQNLIECLSTHRHRRQDWILLTQSLTSVSVDVRKYVENVIEVLNAKSVSLPWPLSISLRDVQILLRGFGVKSQIYRTREGLLEGTYKVAWEGELIVKKTRKEIYALYKSHDKAGSGDSALPFAVDSPGSWRRALVWFFLKHGFRFIFIAACISSAGFVLYGIFAPKRSKSLTLDSHSVDLPQKTVYIMPSSADNDNDVFYDNTNHISIGAKDWYIENGTYREGNYNSSSNYDFGGVSEF